MVLKGYLLLKNSSLSKERSFQTGPTSVEVISTFQCDCLTMFNCISLHTHENSFQGHNFVLWFLVSGIITLIFNVNPNICFYLTDGALPMRLCCMCCHCTVRTGSMGNYCTNMLLIKLYLLCFRFAALLLSFLETVFIMNICVSICVR